MRRETHLDLIEQWLEEHAAHSVSELGRRAGLSTKHLSRVLNRHAYLGPSALIAVAQVIRVDPYRLACAQSVEQIRREIERDE